MLEELKEKVCYANSLLPKNGFCYFTWGNVSAIDREKEMIVIKPTGVPFEELTTGMMSVVDLNGNLIEGLPPSMDTITHLELYRSFPIIGGVTHAHSKWAVIMAQAGQDVPVYGVTHAEYFYGDIPCTIPLSDEQIHKNYRREIGVQIVRSLYEKKLSPERVSACLVAAHGPFAWGKNALDSLRNAAVLEMICMTAWHNAQMQPKANRISQTLLDEHYFTRINTQKPIG
ncbi:MAG: L-ribulose-5-phosphate 4-epimerase AraD [Oscillospiraceae bacterium]|nr:L-ribulose-5-phosphate 4-epimerase AraD [Oscillospiraceae bacterium]